MRGRDGRTRVFLVRHGATTWTEDGRYQGSRHDVPLSPEGWRQAGCVAAALAARPLVVVACSPLRRATETAGIVAASHALDLSPDPAFTEVNLGAWEGMTSAEAADRWPDQHRAWQSNPAAVQPPGGEALVEAGARVAPAFRDLVKYHSGTAVALVAHSLIIRVLLCHALCAGLEGVAHMRCEPGSIAVIDVGGNEATVRQLNETCHLRGKPV